MHTLRLDTAVGSPLSLSTWLSRHQLISVVFAGWITVVVAWSAASGRSGAELITYVAPLLAAGFVATRPALSRRLREYGLVFGIFTAAALVASLSNGSVIAPIGYFIALALVALYERRPPIALGLVLTIAHEAAFGTVVPPGADVAGLPEWASALLYAASFLIVAATLTVPWPVNGAERRLTRMQAALINDHLTVSELVLSLDREGRVSRISDHALGVLALDRAAVIGQDWVGLAVAPEHQEAARHGLSAILDPDGEPLTAPRFFQFEHAVTGGDRVRRVFRWRATVSTDRGEVTGLVAAGVDITDARRVERQLLREQRDLAQLALLAQAVARESDARQAVVEGIANLVDADLAVLVEPAASGDELAVSRSTRAELVGIRVPVSGSPSGTALAYATGDQLFVPEAEGSPLIHERFRELAGAHSFLFQPVIVEGRVAGVLAVAWSAPVAERDSRTGNLVALAADEAASALQRLAALQRWEEAALTDVLTGVPNRRAFDHMFGDALRHAGEEHQPLSIALMDLNGFKALNDLEGHAAGDRVLKECTALWMRELRPTDVLARLGGDEFAVLLPNCGEADVQSVAGRLRRALRHEPGCGVGVAVWDGAETASDLLHRADEALYSDKATVARSRLASPERLAAVEATHLLDEPADPALDGLTETVTSLLGVPISAIVLVGADRQFFAGQCGLVTDSREGPLSHSYCQHPATTGRELIVEDAREHPLLRDNLATTQEGLVAYAGIPLRAGGQTFGVLCAIDRKPRAWTPDELGTLRSIALRATVLIAQRAAAASH